MIANHNNSSVCACLCGGMGPACKTQWRELYGRAWLHHPWVARLIHVP